MGIYLPTVSCLIEKTEIPSALPESYHDITHLLEKYWSSEYSYSCTTNGYEHTVFFELLAGSLDLKFSKIYSREVGFLTPEEASYLKADLCKLEDIFELLSNLVFEVFGSCSGLFDCGFYSVFEFDAVDDLGQIIEAA